MLKKIQFEFEPTHLGPDEWMCWFLRRERANMLGILVTSYGTRFMTADLEDVVQEASVIVWRRIMEGEVSKLTSADMKRLMIRVCRNLLSHDMRHMADEERMDAWEDESRWEKVDEMLRRDAEMDRVTRLRYERLMDCWERLKEKDRIILTKFYWENKTMDEISDEMGLKNDKVAKNYKGRAMKMLREMMKLQK